MNTPTPDLQEQIDKMNQYSLVTYLKLLGHTPTSTNDEFTIFDLPQDNNIDVKLAVNNKTNRFRLTMMHGQGGVLDFIALFFQTTPEEILEDIVPYKLDQLMSAENPKATH
jgi:hypothetical protein